MNNYQYLEEKWKEEHPLTITPPVGPAVDRIDEFRDRFHYRWVRHCDLDEAANVLRPDETSDVIVKPSFLHWITNRADTAFDFDIGEPVRVDGKLGIIVHYVPTKCHLHGYSYNTIYETLAVQTADGIINRNTQAVTRTEFPKEVLELAKAQLLNSCPEVCPLRKKE